MTSTFWSITKFNPLKTKKITETEIFKRVNRKLAK